MIFKDSTAPVKILSLENLHLSWLCYGQTQQRQTDDFITCQLLCISMLLHAYYNGTGFYSWLLKHVCHFQSVDAKCKAIWTMNSIVWRHNFISYVYSSSQHRGQLCAEVNWQRRILEIHSRMEGRNWTVSSWRLSDVNHLLLGYKVSQASQGKLCAHPEEFLYRKIKAFWAWLYNCDSIHKCKNHDFFSEWFDFVLQKLCPMQYCLCSTVASPFSTTGVLAEKLT